MRTLAIGDIHGCLRAFDAVLAAAAPGPQDQLITLGDYVDRGPDSRAILDRLVALHAGGRLVALRGNHDQMLIEARDRPDMMWLLVGGRETLLSYGVPDWRIDEWVNGPSEPPELSEQVSQRVPQAHWDFLDACVAYHETDRHFFVHANALPDLTLDEQPDYMLLWEKLVEPCTHYSGKTMVCGHTKQRSGRPRHWARTICIDTGVYEANGWLTCLEVETGRYWQANQRGEVRSDWLGEPEEEV